MAEFLISRQDDSAPAGWRPVTVVTANVPSTLEESRAIARQGYVGAGRYALVRWDNRKEYDIHAASPDVVDVA